MGDHASALPPLELTALGRAVRRRAAMIRGVLATPWFAAGATLAYRTAGPCAAAAVAGTLIVALLVWTARSLRAYDGPWLARRLNASSPAFDDSLELLFEAPAADEHGLAALQRARLLSRLQQVVLPDLRPRFPRRQLLLVWGGALAATAAALLMPLIARHWNTLTATRAAAGTPRAAALAATGRLVIEPPAYTGLGTQESASLDAKVPEGAKVAFTVRVGTDAGGVTLVFHDGSRIKLQHDGNTWHGERVLFASALYRVQLDEVPPNGAALALADHLYRLDVIPDRPPELIVRAPDHTSSLLSKGQKTWELMFEARDDYGLGPAELSLAHVQGSGENIQTSQQTFVLTGDGDGRHRIYRKTLDLGALGLAEGDDLIVRLAVADNHPAPPNRTESASFVLRWPAEVEALSSGMEGLVQKTLPAYFSSERQLIIDSEALQADRGREGTPRFTARSDALAAEQRILRLRYGEFLGEESERSAQHDADATPSSRAFGDAGNLTSEYGHVHDRPEAATLLDPDTRRLLQGALQEMWQAELHLHQSDPAQALPYEYRALDFIKQVQQAERIYLARSGVQLPQVDASRRLSGDRAGLTDRVGRAAPASTNDAPVAAAWQALANGALPDARLQAWIGQHQATLPDALGLIAAADRAMREPGCTACRARLADLLWPLLPQPAAAVVPRASPDAAASAYLRAIAAPAANP